MSAKVLARNWINERAAKREPLPSMAEIRRQIGMELIEAERAVDPVRYELPNVSVNLIL